MNSPGDLSRKGRLKADRPRVVTGTRQLPSLKTEGLQKLG